MYVERVLQKVKKSEVVGANRGDFVRVRQGIDNAAGSDDNDIYNGDM